MDLLGCRAATTPTFPTTASHKPRPFPFTAKTHIKTINYKRESPLFQPHYSLTAITNYKNTNKTLLSQFFILFTFSFSLLLLRLTSGILLPNFSQRWRNLIAFSSQAEAELIDAPQHLFKAVVAYEDRRFFSHFGVDPIGLARAILSLSARGGGSTITQQLVKNAFLKNERTFLRKFVELVLAVALERRISKLRILSSYLCKIYWGHGIYGIKQASNFYFGKEPFFLSLGESALLISMIPAPEFRSPFRDHTRGKTFQARVLKRMVDGNFLDIETALYAMKEMVQLNAENSLLPASSLKSGPRMPINRTLSTMKEIWNWEIESRIWEVTEEMEKWAKNATEVKRLVKETSR